MHIPKKQPTKLDVAIEEVLDHLNAEQPGTPEYKALLENLEKLYSFKGQVDPARKPLSLDTVLSGAFSLSGILTVLTFEKIGNGVIATKSFGLVPKVK